MSMGLGLLDSIVLAVSPGWALARARARVAASVLQKRHYEAAAPGRRTSGWKRNRGDANAVTRGYVLAELRMHSRDLVRNNGWARRGQRVVANNTVGWGIRPLADAKSKERDAAAELWRRWAETTECDAEGLRTFYGIQHAAVRSMMTDGEVFIRFRTRRLTDGLTIPLQLQILESDFLDSSKDAEKSDAGGPIIQGVEFDKLGRRAAYWLFSSHPGASTGASPVSKRVPAADVMHLFDVERPGQTRGIPWYAAAIVPLKDLDEYEDAALVKAKISACFAALVTSEDSGVRMGLPAGEEEGDEEADLVDRFEPGMIARLQPGEEVQFGTPPIINDSDFRGSNLRRVAAAIGTTYEDLTGDYGNVNYSSARMGRLSHWGNVYHYQENLLVPMLCQPVWARAMSMAEDVGLLLTAPAAEWVAPPMPMLEPDKEGIAYQRLVRIGSMTHAQMLRELGRDPARHWDEYADGLKQLDARAIMLDSDPRKTSNAGLTQARTGIGDTTTPDPVDSGGGG